MYVAACDEVPSEGRRQFSISVVNVYRFIRFHIKLWSAVDSDFVVVGAVHAVGFIINWLPSGVGTWVCGAWPFAARARFADILEVDPEA